MSQSTINDAIAQYIPTMEGWSTVEKCQTIAGCILETKAKISVEIGSFAGRGAISMAFAHRELEHEGFRDTVCHAIDPLEKQPCLEGSNDPLNNEYWDKLDYEYILRCFIRSRLEHSLEKWLIFHRERAENVASHFGPNSIGVLHQDGNHSEEVSCAEVERWHRLIQPGGFWIMDDTDWPTTQKAQQILLEKGFTVTANFEKWKVFRKQ